MIDMLMLLGAGALVAMAATPSRPLPEAVRSEVDRLYPELASLYRELHAAPELSFQETATAARLAERMGGLGFDVTTGVGRTGLVAVLRNGDGPTVMLRTDLDALPIEERTGLPFASTVEATDAGGRPVRVMHACGHDLHMSTWIGAANVLVRLKDRWRGTLVMVGQPAEEIGQGAAAMLADGLFTRFPRPDYALAFHDFPALPAGVVGIVPGPFATSVDSVDITFHGRGGHGAMPHTTVDPVVMAARFVLAVQTVVSRENDPLQPAVITVGSIHGGTKHNIIPDEVHLQLTVRSFDDAVRARLLAGIERIALAEAAASAAPRQPEVRISEGIPPTINDLGLADRIGTALVRDLGEAAVARTRPMTAGEDFGLYGRAGVPALMMFLGVASATALEAASAGGPPVPPLHSPRFAPELEPSLRAGVAGLSLAALELLARRP